MEVSFKLEHISQQHNISKKNLLCQKISASEKDQIVLKKIQIYSLTLDCKHKYTQASIISLEHIL